MWHVAAVDQCCIAVHSYPVRMVALDLAYGPLIGNSRVLRFCVVWIVCEWDWCPGPTVIRLQQNVFVIGCRSNVIFVGSEQSSGPLSYSQLWSEILHLSVKWAAPSGWSFQAICMVHFVSRLQLTFVHGHWQPSHPKRCLVQSYAIGRSVWNLQAGSRCPLFDDSMDQVYWFSLPIWSFFAARSSQMPAGVAASDRSETDSPPQIGSAFTRSESQHYYELLLSKPKG